MFHSKTINFELVFALNSKRVSCLLGYFVIGLEMPFSADVFVPVVVGVEAVYSSGCPWDGNSFLLPVTIGTEPRLIQRVQKSAAASEDPNNNGAKSVFVRILFVSSWFLSLSWKDHGRQNLLPWSALRRLLLELEQVSRPPQHMLRQISPFPVFIRSRAGWSSGCRRLAADFAVWLGGKTRGPGSAWPGAARRPPPACSAWRGAAAWRVVADRNVIREICHTVQ